MTISILHFSTQTLDAMDDLLEASDSDYPEVRNELYQFLIAIRNDNSPQITIYKTEAFES